MKLDAQISLESVKCPRQQAESGYCSLVESMGCETCYREFEERMERS